MSALRKVDSDGGFDLQSELDRKTLDALRVLYSRYEFGQITEHQLSEALSTLYRAVFGLVKDDTLGDVMDAYKSSVSTQPCYCKRLWRSTDKLTVIWFIEDDYITIAGDDLGENQIKISSKVDPHDSYEKLLTLLGKKGWKEDE